MRECTKKRKKILLAQVEGNCFLLVLDRQGPEIGLIPCQDLGGGGGEIEGGQLLKFLPKDYYSGPDTTC